jgi:hypothetical protein
MMTAQNHDDSMMEYGGKEHTNTKVEHLQGNRQRLCLEKINE